MTLDKFFPSLGLRFAFWNKGVLVTFAHIKHLWAFSHLSLISRNEGEMRFICSMAEGESWNSNSSSQPGCLPR